MELVSLAVRRLALVWVALIVYKYLMGDSQEEEAKVSMVVSSERKSSSGHK